MEPKKISFGFNKVSKKSNFFSKKKEKSPTNIELIKYVEDREIKLVKEKSATEPLVVPLIENQKTSTALTSLKIRRDILLGDEYILDTSKALNQISNSDSQIMKKNSLEQRAAMELMEDVKRNGSAETNTLLSTLVLPKLKADEIPLDGAKQSTLDDYHNIPVEQFGKAMLRGMGWVESSNTQSIDEMPKIRPKGMGLGADKALKPKPLLVMPEPNEILMIKTNAYVRIIAGKYKDLYGQIQGFDDYAGRVIVKMAIGGLIEAFNEFLCHPISKREYVEFGKCINSVKYNEYKKNEIHAKTKELYHDPVRIQTNNENDCNHSIKLKKELNSLDSIKRKKEEKEEKDRKRSHEDYSFHSSHRRLKDHKHTSTIDTESLECYKERSHKKNKADKQKETFRENRKNYEIDREDSDRSAISDSQNASDKNHRNKLRKKEKKNKKSHKH